MTSRWVHIRACSTRHTPFARSRLPPASSPSGTTQSSPARQPSHPNRNPINQSLSPLSTAARGSSPPDSIRLHPAPRGAARQENPPNPNPSCGATARRRGPEPAREDAVGVGDAVPLHADAVQGAAPAEHAVGVHRGGARRALQALRQGRQHHVQRRRQPQPGLRRVCKPRPPCSYSLV